VRIPPKGWPEFATRQHLELLQVATKSDFALLEERLGHRIDAADKRIEKHEERLDQRIEGAEHLVIAALRGEHATAVTTLDRNLFFTALGAVVATGSAVLAAARFG
jgi:hypothetical protein